MSHSSVNVRRPWSDVRFVLHNDPRNKQARRAARSHSQREAWRRRRLDALRRLWTGDKRCIQRNSGPAATTAADTEDRRSYALHQVHSPSFQTWVSRVNGDPFDAAVATIDSMLHAYLVFFARSMWPVFSVHQQSHQFLKTFGAIAIEDEAVLYAIVTSAAARQSFQAHYSASAPNVLAQRELHYMNRALRCLRVRLESSQRATLDNTIGVIGLLAMCEAVDPGRVATSRTHLLAAKQILDTPGKGGVLSWTWYERLAAADVKSACIGSTPPLLPPLDRTQSTRRIRELIGGGEVPVASAFESREVELQLSASCRRLIQDIRDLSIFKDSLMGQSEDFDDDAYDPSLFQYQRIALEQALLSFTTSSTAPLRTSIESCVHIGLMLVINTLFWVNFGGSSAILAVPSQRLRQLLQLLELEEDIDGLRVSPTMKTLGCWLTFVGAHATYMTEQYPWFKNRLRLTTRELNLQSCSRLRKALTQYIYAEQIYRPTLEDICRG